MLMSACNISKLEKNICAENVFQKSTPGNRGAPFMREPLSIELIRYPIECIFLIELTIYLTCHDEGLLYRDGCTPKTQALKGQEVNKTSRI